MATVYLEWPVLPGWHCFTRMDPGLPRMACFTRSGQFYLEWPCFTRNGQFYLIPHLGSFILAPHLGSQNTGPHLGSRIQDRTLVPHYCTAPWFFTAPHPISESAPHPIFRIAPHPVIDRMAPHPGLLGDSTAPWLLLRWNRTLVPY